MLEAYFVIDANMSEMISRVFVKELKSTKLSVWLTWEHTHEKGEHQRLAHPAIDNIAC